MAFKLVEEETVSRFKLFKFKFKFGGRRASIWCILSSGYDIYIITRSSCLATDSRRDVSGPKRRRRCSVLFDCDGSGKRGEEEDRPGRMWLCLGGG